MYSLLISMCIAGCFVSSISAFRAQTDRFPPSSSSSTCPHHGRPMAAILLEPLPVRAATASACLGHGRRPIHADNHVRPHGPFHSHAPTASGSPLHATAFDITTISYTAAKHLSFRRHRHHSLRPHQQHHNRSTVPLTRLHRHLLLQFHLQPQPSKSPGTPRIPVGTQTPFTDITPHQLHRHIQPTQWSRRVGIAGLPTFEVFPWLLAYHGTADFTARTLSHGKFCGLIPTRSVAESVFTTHLLQEIRDKRLDLDAIAEAMHTKAGTTIPNKTTQARAFHSPLIRLLTDQLQAHSPAVAEGSAIRALKATSDDLARAREKLQPHGLELTPKKDTGRPSAPAPPAPHQPPALPDVLQPSYPTLKDDAPEAWTAPSIQQWMRTSEPKVQEAAQQILRLLQTSKVSTDQLKEAATRYGLPLIRVNKLSIKSLQHIVSVGAAIAC